MSSQYCSPMIWSVLLFLQGCAEPSTEAADDTAKLEMKYVAGRCWDTDPYFQRWRFTGYARRVFFDEGAMWTAHLYSTHASTEETRGRTGPYGPGQALVQWIGDTPDGEFEAAGCSIVRVSERVNNINLNMTCALEIQPETPSAARAPDFEWALRACHGSNGQVGDDLRQLSRPTRD